MLIACMQNKMKNKDKKYIKRSLKYLAPLTQVPKKYKSSIVPLLSDDCIHKICESCQNLLQNTYGFDKRKLFIKMFESQNLKYFLISLKAKNGLSTAP